jgi:hypothetical protein
MVDYYKDRCCGDHFYSTMTHIVQEVDGDVDAAIDVVGLVYRRLECELVEVLGQMAAAARDGEEREWMLRYAEMLHLGVVVGLGHAQLVAHGRYMEGTTFKG